MKIKIIALAVLLAITAAKSADIPLHKGESRAQVEAKFGRPSEVQHSGATEICTYSPGSAKMFIPIFGELSGQKEYRITYRHGVVVAWVTQTISAQ
jgi:hypothetical protein